MVQQLSLFNVSTVIDYGQSILSVASEIQKLLAKNTVVSTKTIQALMNRYFLGKAAEGAWTWKDAYEALEVSQILYLRDQADFVSLPATEVVAKLEELTCLCPTHTKRDEQQIRLQQFSTPLPLAYLVAHAGQVQGHDLTLEPSAGNGAIAQLAKLYGASLMLNELDTQRTQILRRLFPGTPLFQVNAEQIDDLIPHQARPSVVLMNPPFSASPKISERNPEATARHVTSALKRLTKGGRLVTITANGFSPMSDRWRETFVKMQEEATVLLSVGIDGKVYTKHGTNIETRLTVIDKVCPTNSHDFNCIGNTVDLAELITLINQLPTRPVLLQELEKPKITDTKAVSRKQTPLRQCTNSTVIIHNDSKTPQVGAVPLEYSVVERTTSNTLNDGIYQTYRPQRVKIYGAKPHPSLLCESAALALVVPPVPTYKPLLPPHVVEQGLLSEAQLESIVYAGEAHEQFLSGWYLVDDSYDNISVTSSTQPDAVRYRKGWFLGDSTGCGKGRQVAGCILDNWYSGRKKALWVSKTGALLEDAKRDYSALGGNENHIFDLSDIKLGSPIPFNEGILFTTYSTLRSVKGEKSRMAQILEWVGKDFEGVIAFDECHAMGGAMPQQGKLGMQKASMQGLVGLRLQNALPLARVIYVSATGATKVSNLSYAIRLGLWQTGDFPFTSREDFVTSIESGGIAAMEVLSRDLKALGLYLARSLSFEGVEYETLEVALSQTQQQIYDSYAEAFQIIHANLYKALEACNIVGSKHTYNRAAKMSAMSQFESHKQRFFNHLLIGMKCPQLIKAIERDLEQGHAVVVQIVSTNEELLTRQLKEIPQDEWNDLNVDLTPREYMMHYLMSAFPIHLHEIYSSEDGEQRSQPIFDDGNPIISQEALALREKLIDKLTSLAPVPGALDQLLWHFGHNKVAEVTGRSKRVLKDEKTGRLFVGSRGNSTNIVETSAFMSNEKQILIFSDAGGTGRSYHADLNCINRHRRCHYLLEPGWKADTALQGLGRSHRTNQASAPIFRLVTTNVTGERRFMSTIAQRLDSLGALTKGQRQAGSNGIFSAQDNLESDYAQQALYEMFKQIYQGRFAQVSLSLFEESTGLSLTSTEGGMKSDLPPLRQFLNRLLALKIEMQNLIFERFELLLNQEIETAIAAGVYEVGVETIKAHKLNLVNKETVYTHSTGSTTNYLKIERIEKNSIKNATEMIEFASSHQGQFMVNQTSGGAAVCIPTTSILDSNGGVIRRVLLVRPQKEIRVPLERLQESTWREVPESEFIKSWSQEVEKLPEFITDSIHLVTGILLPIWKVFPCKSSRVYRLQLSDGENVLGRVVDADNIRTLSEQLGLKNKLLSPSELVDLVINNRYSEELPGGVMLRSSLIENERRIELINALPLVEQLVAVGCFTEIINWKKRVFIPTSEKAADILAAVINILS